MFQHVINEIAKGNLNYAFPTDTGIPGIVSIIATTPYMPYPIGTVWYRWHGHHSIDILNSYVVEPVRRLGVRTFLHHKLIEAFQPHGLREMYTHLGNELSTPWLKKIGFKQTDTGWRFKIKRG